MLVLSRYVEQSIVIDGHIRVTVVGVERSGRVKLGIEAPQEIKVDREEIHERRTGESRE